MLLYSSSLTRGATLIVVQVRVAVLHCLDGGLGVGPRCESAVVDDARRDRRPVFYDGALPRIGIAHDVVLVNCHRFRERRDGGKGNERIKGDVENRKIVDELESKPTAWNSELKMAPR